MPDSIKCQMCDAAATWQGYCDEHRDVLRKQLVLDALDARGKPSTAIEVRDDIRDRFRVFLSWAQVAAAIRSLHHGGFLAKHPTPGVQHAAKWSMV